ASELGDRAGVERRVADYHLRYLARLGLLREEPPLDGPRRFAPPASPRASPLASLDDRLLDVVRERPGASTAEVARLVGLTLSRADRRLKSLALEGRVESDAS